MSTIEIKQFGLDQWTAPELNSLEHLNFLEGLVLELSLTLNPGDSYALYLTLDSLLKQHGARLKAEYSARYQTALKKLGVLAWFNMSEETIKGYLTGSLIFILTTPLPIMSLIASQIRWYKWAYPEILGRYLGYLRENNELVGQVNLSYIFAAKDNRPSVKNWLNDFIIFSGSPKELNSLNFIKYFNESPNVKLLTKAEARILKRALKLYSILTSPFAHQNFFREPYLFDDYFETVLPDQPSASPTLPAVAGAAVKPAVKDNNLAKAEQLYHGAVASLADRYNISSGLKKYQNLNLNQLTELLKEAPADPAVVLPTLSLIAQKDKSLNLAGKDLKKFFKAALSAAGLAENESAVFLMQLARANKKLVGLTYLDVKTLTFKWR